MRQAAFTLSLDCEGLWGMADQPALLASGRINQASLATAYNLICKTLDDAGLIATAAFVSGFAVGPEAVRQHAHLLSRLADLVPSWFDHLLPALNTGRVNGWDGSEFYKSMKAAGHEMAWHGATHMPLTSDTPAQAVELELQLHRAVVADTAIEAESIVFPRNRIGHLALLRAAGFKTYRASPPQGVLGRLSVLAQEWNIWDNRVGIKPCRRDAWYVSPAGFYLNWPSGVRGTIPPAVTVMRWKSLLRNAAQSGGYVHMWFHPHNFITAPAMVFVFQQVMAEVGRLVRTGDMHCLTMRQANAHFVDVGG
jgi:hypothetical protein